MYTTYMFLTLYLVDDDILYEYNRKGTISCLGMQYVPELCTFVFYVNYAMCNMYRKDAIYVCAPCLHEICTTELLYSCSGGFMEHYYQSMLFQERCTATQTLYVMYYTRVVVSINGYQVCTSPILFKY